MQSRGKCGCSHFVMLSVINKNRKVVFLPDMKGFRAVTIPGSSLLVSDASSIFYLALKDYLQFSFERSFSFSAYQPYSKNSANLLEL